jgi:hypothetical protein
VIRAIRAARAAGVDIARIEVAHDGKITLVLGGVGAEEGSALDEWLANNARAS